MKLLKRYIIDFFSKQINLMVIFVVLMLVPSIALAITEPYRLSTVVASLLIPAGFYILWLQLARRVGLMILLSLPFMVFGAFQLVLLYMFGNSIIAVDMFVNLFTTNVKEASELLANITPAIVGVIVLYLPLLAMGVLSLYLKDKTPHRKLNSIIGGTIMIVGFGLTLVSKSLNPDFAIKYHIFPLNVFYNISLTADKVAKDKAFFDTSKDFKYNTIDRDTTTARKVYVLVVGEASRATNWQLFGYKKETNPNLSKVDNLLFFDDVTSQANATHKAVPIILSSVSAENYNDIYNRKSVVSLFKEAGYKTYYFSGQLLNGSLIEFFSSEADSVVDVASLKASEGKPYYDTDLLPYVQEAIDSSDENLFIVLHTYGSHFKFRERYPDSACFFKDDNAPNVQPRYRDMVVNSYDNAVRYSDYMLSCVIDMLDKSGSVSAMLYCSDHGEDLMDDERERFLHASPTPTYFQVHSACFAWYSDGYSQLFPDMIEGAKANLSVPATTANIFHTMADMAMLESEYVDNTKSLFSRGYKVIERCYLDDYTRAVTFYDAHFTNYDFEAMEKYGIEYDSSRVHNSLY